MNVQNPHSLETTPLPGRLTWAGDRTLRGSSRSTLANQICANLDLSKKFQGLSRWAVGRALPLQLSKDVKEIQVPRGGASARPRPTKSLRGNARLPKN